MSPDVPIPPDEPAADRETEPEAEPPAEVPHDPFAAPVVATTHETQDNGTAPRVELLHALKDQVERGFEELRSLFQREVRAEITREKVVDRLHSELQDYKQDLLLNAMRPVFVDLIQLHDDIGKVAIRPEGPATTSLAEVDRLLELMRGFQQGIEDILYRQGVEPFEVEGDAFDPRRQRAVSTVLSENPAQVKTVAARLRKGFRSGDRVVRPEIVSVYAAKPMERR